MKILEAKITEEIKGLKGRIGLVIEIGEEQIQVNGLDVFQSASLIKIPILIEALRRCEDGKMSESDPVPIGKEAIVGGSGVLQTLSPNALLTVKDLMTLMIIVSDNTATNLLIDLLGMNVINRFMRQFGLTRTELNRKMMDFQAIEQGRDNYTSPLDIVQCLKWMTEGTVLSKDSQLIALEIMRNQQFKDKLPAQMDHNQVLVANKTGELPKVEHDCAVIQYGAKTAFVSVLMDQLEDLHAGKQTLNKMGKHIYDYLVD
ncbi:serine hydrolase [Neobacillus sp.]|uniref:serine hydrolase n=1 Tax=Neobacillus sp. TaxID=2675273 RepID=UPI0028A26F7D|nr:serine hydrolase [Neobacillus sp.]